MGDKGKKDKEKGRKQKIKKQGQKAKKRLDRQSGNPLDSLGMNK